MWHWLCLLKEDPGVEEKAQKSSFPASSLSPTIPTSQSPAKEGMLDAFPWNHKWEETLL